MLSRAVLRRPLHQRSRASLTAAPAGDSLYNNCSNYKNFTAADPVPSGGRAPTSTADNFDRGDPDPSARLGTGRRCDSIHWMTQQPETVQDDKNRASLMTCNRDGQSQM